jgi:hypothetical protein
MYMYMSMYYMAMIGRITGELERIWKEAVLT